MVVRYSLWKPMSPYLISRTSSIRKKPAKARIKIHTFRNSSKLSRLDFSTNFLIMSRETGSFLLQTLVPIILLAALLTAWMIELSVGEGKPAKWCAHCIPNMTESTAEWEWVVSSKCSNYNATCSDFVGNAQISLLELANTFQLRKALL